jgi:general secretion pathway protein A
VYTDFYGFSELPFELNPNPRYLLLPPRHREALANLQYGISARKSLTLLLGEAGTGKTTLVHAAMSSGPGRTARIVHLDNPVVTRGEFVQFLARGFGLSHEATQSKVIMLAELRQVLLDRRDAGVTTALVIDEAQALSHELLEEVRLLANIETPEEKLLPVILAGQPELAERLNQPSLRQLKQRVALRCTLGLLDLVETAAYIHGRIRIAGGDATALFTREAIELIHLRSLGVPRTISVICDNALVSGFAAGVHTISADIVREVCADFDLGPSSNGNGTAAAGRTFLKIDRAAAMPPPAPPPTAARTAAPPLQEPPQATDTPEPGGMFATFGKKKRFSFF